MIIGVAGKLESGKDTLADYLVEEYGYRKLAFADNLKQLCMGVFNLTHYQVYTTEGKLEEFVNPVEMTLQHLLDIKEWLTEINGIFIDGNMFRRMLSFEKTCGTPTIFKSARRILQFVGTEIMRDCVDADIHAKIVFNQIKKENLKHVVISDARFENERKITRSYGGKMLLVDCVQTREQESSHRSETGLGEHSEYNEVIVNDKEKGLESFYEKIKYVMEFKL